MDAMIRESAVPDSESEDGRGSSGGVVDCRDEAGAVDRWDEAGTVDRWDEAGTVDCWDEA